MKIFEKHDIEVSITAWFSHAMPLKVFCLLLSGAMRRASPVVVLSLLILFVALGFSTVGNSKRDYKTLVGAVLYVVGGNEC